MADNRTCRGFSFSVEAAGMSWGNSVERQPTSLGALSTVMHPRGIAARLRTMAKPSSLTSRDRHVRSFGEVVGIGSNTSIS